MSLPPLPFPDVLVLLPALMAPYLITTHGIAKKTSVSNIVIKIVIWK